MENPIFLFYSTDRSGGSIIIDLISSFDVMHLLNVIYQIKYYKEGVRSSMLNYFLIIVLCLLFLIFIHILISFLTIRVVPMPSSSNERRAVASILREYDQIKEVTDLGSGWGGLIRDLNQSFPEHHFTAIEKSFVPYTFSRMIQFMSGSGILRHERADIHDIPLKSNHAYICYLSGPAMKKLRKRFEKDLPTEGILISIAFAMPGWTPCQTEYIDSFIHSPVYVYEF